MVPKIHPWGVTWVPSFRLMWADQLKKTESSSVHILRSPWADTQLMFLSWQKRGFDWLSFVNYYVLLESFCKRFSKRFRFSLEILEIYFLIFSRIRGRILTQTLVLSRFLSYLLAIFFPKNHLRQGQFVFYSKVIYTKYS